MASTVKNGNDRLQKGNIWLVNCGRVKAENPGLNETTPTVYPL